MTCSDPTLKTVWGLWLCNTRICASDELARHSSGNRCGEWKASSIKLPKTFRRTSKESRGCNRRVAVRADTSHDSPISCILRNGSPNAAKTAATFSASK